MSGEASSPTERLRISQLPQDGRLQHPPDWLRDRVESFLNGTYSRAVGQPWGWKEPNTHIIIDRLLEAHPSLRYIHFVRHPIDMSLSRNQNQLENWGPVLLNRNVTTTPRESLAYWCAAHRRLNVVMHRWPERTMTIDFDQFCEDPAKHGDLVASFLDVGVPDQFHASLRSLIDTGVRSSGRYKQVDLNQFDKADLEYVRGIGYAL